MDTLRGALEALGVEEFTWEDIIVMTNNFDLKDCIGFGGNGKVYRSYFPASRITLAIKQIEFGEDDLEQRKKWVFLRCLKMLVKCRHTCIVHIIGYALCHDGKKGCIITEYLERGSVDKTVLLKGFIEKAQSTLSSALENVIPSRKRLQIALDVANGLKHLHDHGVVHRDIKSANIGINECDRAKLLDFDLVKVLDGSQYEESHTGFTDLLAIPTSRDVIEYTHGYVDPNYKADPARGYQKFHDIYSFGIVLTELYCGRLIKDVKLSSLQRQFQEFDFSLADEYGEWSRPVLLKLCPLILKCIELNNPEARPPAEALVYQLEEMCEIMDKRQTGDILIIFFYI